MGDLFVDTLDPKNSIVFGPALVKSYRLKSTYAIYPRIVIDRDLIALAESGGYNSSFQDFYRRSEDGAYFVDYLFGRCAIGFTIPTPAGSPSPVFLLDAHRKAVEAEIEYPVAQKDESIKRKCIWLALYHNRTLKLLRDRFGTQSSERFERFAIQENKLRL